MGKILPVALDVDGNEPALYLAEIDQPTNVAGEGNHRIQCIHVVRKDEPAEYRIDLGPSINFKADPLEVVCGGKEFKNGRETYWSSDSVADVQEIAEQLRNRQTMAEMFDVQPSDLVGRYADQMEFNRDRRKHPGKEVFGYGS